MPARLVLAKHVIFRLSRMSLLIPALSFITPAQAADGSVLQQMIIVGRHGVRAPVHPNSVLDQYSTQAFPTFPVAPGQMTPQGNQDETTLGTYYRAYMVDQGLLSGNAGSDAPLLYFRANNEVQRSIDSAADLAAGIAPGAMVANNNLPSATPDPLFNPLSTVATIDFNEAAASDAGEYGSDPTELQTEYQPEIHAFQDILTGGSLTATSQNLSSQAFTFSPGTIASGIPVALGGLQTLQLVTEPFLLEYVDGLPMSQVAFGKLTPALLQELSNPAFLDLTFRTPYLARVQGSDLAYHVGISMLQSAFGAQLGGGLGTPQTKLVALIGSDSHVTAMAGLLDLHWLTPGAMPGYAALGGALVFELRRAMGDGHLFVRTYYQTQTFDQLRNATPLTLAAPPARSPVFVPGASTSNATFDAPLPAFIAKLAAAIDFRQVRN